MNQNSKRITPDIVLKSNVLVQQGKSKKIKVRRFIEMVALLPPNCTSNIKNLVNIQEILDC